VQWYIDYLYTVYI